MTQSRLACILRNRKNVENESENENDDDEEKKSQQTIAAIGSPVIIPVPAIEYKNNMDKF